jgi:tetratricopeptide (TPR) repeat protein
MGEHEKPITVWPFELVFACAVAAVIAAATASANSDSAQRLGIGMLAGAVAYLLGLLFSRIGFVWLLDGNDQEGCLYVIALGLIFTVYYVIVAVLCRYLILPIGFRMAGMRDVQVPPIFKSKSDRAAAAIDKASQPYQDESLANNTRGLTHWDKVIQWNPDYAEAYDNRGLAYFSQGDFERAIADYDKAIQLKPDFAVAYGHRGTAYQQQGQRDRAMDDFRKALECSHDPEVCAFVEEQLQALGAK